MSTILNEQSYTSGGVGNWKGHCVITTTESNTNYQITINTYAYHFQGNLSSYTWKSIVSGGISSTSGEKTSPTYAKGSAPHYFYIATHSFNINKTIAKSVTFTVTIRHRTTDSPQVPFGNGTLYIDPLYLTFNFEVGEHGKAIAPQIVTYNTAAVRPKDPFEYKWDFLGWYTDNTYENLYDFSNLVTNNTTIYGNWREKEIPPILDNNIIFDIRKDGKLVALKKEATNNIVTNEDRKISYEGLELQGNEDIGLENFIENEESIIPDDDYIALDYIESGGSQYIDTGIIPDNSQDYEFDITAQMLNYFQYRGPFGAYESENHYCTRAIPYGLSGWYYYAGTKAANPSGSDNTLNYSDLYRYEITYNSSTITDLDARMSIIVPMTHTAATSTQAHFLLFKTSITEANSQPCRIWKCKIKYQNELVRDMIPCYRKSDGEIGMYDLINQQFYGNNGTGTFSINSKYTDDLLNCEIKKSNFDVSYHSPYTNESRVMEIQNNKELISIGRNILDNPDYDEIEEKMTGIYIGQEHQDEADIWFNLDKRLDEELIKYINKLEVM